MKPENYNGFPRYTGPDPDHRVRQRQDIDTAWMQSAACQGMDSSTFFPEVGDVQAIRKARLVCSTCPVLAQCAEASKDEVHGVWAGLTPAERGKVHGIRRRWPA